MTTTTDTAAVKEEIAGMLVLTTAVTSFETNEWIHAEYARTKLPGQTPVITLYQKDEYGWFIVVPHELEPERVAQIPTDLYGVLTYVKALGCSWLMLDRDADPSPNLPVFDW